MEKNSEEYNRILGELAGYCNESGKIDQNLYVNYDVKRGLRDSTGKGVLTGLTEISDVIGYDVVDGERVPTDGRLYYQGYNVEDLERGFHGSKFGFEETIYLLLFGKLPNEQQFRSFVELMECYRELPRKFTRDVILKAPSKNMMNVLQRCVLTLYSYDDNPDDIKIENVLRQCMELIAQFPIIAAYGYQGYKHYFHDMSLVIHNPKPGLSTAENFLRLIRTDKKYTELEAQVLDICLVIHAEHGGGNNSTFTTHVVSSTGTDTYSAVASSLGSLKGPKHGGANLKVQQMFDDLKAHVSLKSTSQDFSTRRDSIIPDLFMEWDMRCIRTLIRVPEYSRDMPRDLQRKREEQRNLSCTDQLNRYQEDCWLPEDEVANLYLPM